MASLVTTGADVTTRANMLVSLFQRVHQEWVQLDNWRAVDADAVEEDVWRGLPEKVRRRTIVKTDIAAITDTGVAFLLGDDPQVEGVPKDITSTHNQDMTNAVERLGTALLEEVDETRTSPFVEEAGEMIFHRGHGVSQVGWLGIEERGEKRGPIDMTGLDGEEPLEQITTEGEFPLTIRLLDPIECAWNLGPKGDVIEMLHEYQASWSTIVELYPDIMDRPAFRTKITVSTYDREVTVRDYWDREINAIVIDGSSYKDPRPHLFGECPFVVEMAKPKLTGGRRTPRNAGATVVNVPQGQKVWGTPFCQPILKHVMDASWADSILAPYLETLAYATMTHRGLDSRTGATPHVDVDEDGNTIYDPSVETSPDSPVFPLFNNEILDYIKPPELVAHLQEFKAQRQRDIQLLTFHESIMMGVYNVNPLSGVSVSMQKQAAMARLEPYKLALSRWLSRTMTLAIRMAVKCWDRSNIAIFLQQLVGTGGQAIPITKDLFEAVARITVTITPKIPVNQEAEMQSYYHGLELDVYTLREVQEKAGVKDPSSSIMRRAYEKSALNKPEFLDALAWEYAYREGLISKDNPYGPRAAEGQQPAALPAGPQAMDPAAMMAGQMPPGQMDPAAMLGQQMPGMNGGMGGGGDIASALASMAPSGRMPQ